jgi:enamine deaminase RidA (YjgF/YER057c/UK114 family)
MFLTLLTLALSAQDVQRIQPKGISASPSYTHVVTAKGGRTVWISGQVAQNAKGEIVGKGDLKVQLTQVYENLKLALASVGATFNDVVKVNTYIVNYKPSMRADVREVRAKFMGAANPPASTLVGVQALATEDYLVEIEMTAVVKE